ncbi:MAG: DUF6502 family protein [Woeseiaceae bacterium]|nr:DUF6502 family protein [Woeseiaceae bacterium]
MQDSLKQQVLNAFLLVLRPITRILLRYGIGYREFVEVAKTAYVDVASSDYGLRGRPTNISRVAVMTGLTRKEVKRIRDKIASGDASISVKATPLADVLHNWHAVPEFTDEKGNPARLPFSGDERSFSSLVKTFGGDVPAGAMRTELKRVGAVKEDDEGCLIAVSRALIPDADHEKLITALVHGAYSVLSNIAHNSDPETIDSRWAGRIAHTTKLHKSDTGQLRRIARDRIRDFVEAIDDLFIAYEALHGDENAQKGDPVAVGVFYFEEQDKNAKYEW